jgi:hypothetical protein
MSIWQHSRFVDSDLFLKAQDKPHRNIFSFWAHFFAAKPQKKPGCMGEQQNCGRNFTTSRDFRCNFLWYHEFSESRSYFRL